jgi:hypothetical protein
VIVQTGHSKDVDVQIEVPHIGKAKDHNKSAILKLQEYSANSGVVSDFSHESTETTINTF